MRTPRESARSGISRGSDARTGGATRAAQIPSIGRCRQQTRAYTGACSRAIVATGHSPTIGFIHVGRQLSFVYDIADLYKPDVSIPVALAVVRDGEADGESGCECRCASARGAGRGRGRRWDTHSNTADGDGSRQREARSAEALHGAAPFVSCYAPRVSIARRGPRSHQDVALGPP
jgi:hypothetical protein